jgi:hypothetical protein
MRDTDLLRLRIGAALTCLSVAGACEAPTGGENRSTPAARGDDAKAGFPRAAGSELDDTEREDDAPAVVPDPANKAAPYQPKEGEFDFYGPPRDPWNEHDEEEGCPNGDWCGSPADAALFQVQGLDPVMGCPARIVANPQADVKNKKAKTWKGFSFDDRMQGRLVTTVTEQERQARKVEDLCCYHWFEYCSGRPLLGDDDDPILAAWCERDDWTSRAPATDVDVDTLSAALRATLTAEWLADARMEHASIGAFARATLELMALAAPAELLAEVQAAALDEVRHAGRCFALAGRYAGRALGPGPLPIAPPRPASFARLARDTFVEGCVGETIAALAAARQARACEDAAVADTLAMIASDEARHAALAWRTVEWALAQGGPEVALALRAAAAHLRPRADDPEPLSGPHGPHGPSDLSDPNDPNTPNEELLARHGRLDAAGRAAVRSDAWREIVDPTLARLLDAALGPSARV